jgi:hypothetical protein
MGDAIAAILRRHVPEAAARVVGGRELYEAYYDGSGVNWDDLTAYGTEGWTRAAARLTARAAAADADTIPVRVIRRPVETTTALVVPETGWYAERYVDGTMGGPFYYPADSANPDDTCAAIRRIDTDAPTTWIERGATTTARAWTAEMIPEGVCALYRGGAIVDYFGVGSKRETVAIYATRKDIDTIAILPATLEGGQ